MSFMEVMELASYLATAIGVPLAILIFVLEQRRERENEEKEIYEMLSSAYADFLALVIDNPDLRLRTAAATPGLSDEQKDRQKALFEILIALFERAYLYAWSDEPSGPRRRRWASWEDYIAEWCRREDFRELLPDLLRGEDQAFADYVRSVAAREGGGVAAPPDPTSPFVSSEVEKRALGA